MTEEELDILASSYLDGEATSQEVALVERDPAIMTRVQQLRAAQGALQVPVTVPRSQKEQHLAAALGAFAGTDRRSSLPAVGPSRGDPYEADGTIDVTTSPGPAAIGDGEDQDAVVDLRSRREQRNSRDANRMRWLSAAAAFVVFGFGAVYLATQMNSANDTIEVASDAATDDEADAGDTAESADFDAAADDTDNSAEPGSEPLAADESTGAESAPTVGGDAGQMSSEAQDADAERDLAAEDVEAVEEESAADGETVDEPAGPVPPTLRVLPDEGFFPDEPVVTYANVPTGQDMLDDLNLRWREPGTAKCITSPALPENSEVVAYLPIEVTAAGGTLEPAEALYLVIDGATSQVLLVNPDTCELF